MKRKTTKEILAESFREIAENKNADKITIQEIVDNCEYSPATFYRHFKDKYDLIAWDYARGTAEVMNKIGGEYYSWRQTLIDGAKRVQVEKEYLINLLRHTSGHDSFVLYMTDINFDYLKKHFLSASGKIELTKTEELCVRLYCLGTVCLTCEWLLGKIEATPEQIAGVYEKSLPESLRKYLA